MVHEIYHLCHPVSQFNRHFFYRRQRSIQWKPHIRSTYNTRDINKLIQWRAWFTILFPIPNRTSLPKVLWVSYKNSNLSFICYLNFKHINRREDDKPHKLHTGEIGCIQCQRLHFFCSTMHCPLGSYPGGKYNFCLRVKTEHAHLVGPELEEFCRKSMHIWKGPPGKLDKPITSRLITLRMQVNGTGSISRGTRLGAILITAKLNCWWHFHGDEFSVCILN